MVKNYVVTCCIVYDHTVTPTPNIILTTDITIGGSIYTAMFNERQAVQLNLNLDASLRDRRSIGEYIMCYCVYCMLA